MDPRYEVQLRTRGYECESHTRCVKLPVFLSYLEHMRWEWICHPGWELGPLVDAGHFFVVRTQEITLSRRVPMNTDLVVRGWVERAGRSQVLVGHEIDTADGEPVARARVSGVWLGPNRRLARLPDTVRRLGDKSAAWPHLQLDEAPPADARRVAFQIRRSRIDMLEHVNATSYLELFEDARSWLEGDAWIPASGVRISYDGEAVEHDEVQVALAPGEAGCAAWLLRGDAVLCRAFIETNGDA